MNYTYPGAPVPRTSPQHILGHLVDPVQKGDLAAWEFLFSAGAFDKYGWFTTAAARTNLEVRHLRRRAHLDHLRRWWGAA